MHIYSYNYRFGLANYNNIATYQIHVSIDAVLKQSVIMKLVKTKYAWYKNYNNRWLMIISSCFV